MSRAVRYSSHGDVDVINIVDVPTPKPPADQLLIRVHAAGIQPFDNKVRRGDFAGSIPKSFPAGLGVEFAGIVEELGASVSGFSVGDEVIGWTASGHSHADHALGSPDTLAAKPPEMPWTQAGALASSGQTAHTAIEALDVTESDTLLLHAASGGVGSIAAQLAVARGATVVGTASANNHEYLRSLGVQPVLYGRDLVENVRAVTEHVTVALDAVGTDEAITASLALVNDRRRIGTLAHPTAPDEHGIAQLGTEYSLRRLRELIALYSAGKLRVHIHHAYPLDDARTAYQAVEQGHVRGKIVLVTEPQRQPRENVTEVAEDVKAADIDAQAEAAARSSELLDRLRKL